MSSSITPDAAGVQYLIEALNRQLTTEELALFIKFFKTCSRDYSKGKKTNMFHTVFAGLNMVKLLDAMTRGDTAKAETLNRMLCAHLDRLTPPSTDETPTPTPATAHGEALHSEGHRHGHPSLAETFSATAG